MSVNAGMTEQDEEYCLRVRHHLCNPPPGEEVCITGASGTFPESENLHEFRDNLFSKKDLVTVDQRRWDHIYSDIPKQSGKIPHIDKFDAGFFGMSYKYANTADPQVKILLEKSVEAIIDAGLNPADLEGSRCGVFVGTGFSESEHHWFLEDQIPQAYPILHNMRSMQANRISYFLKLNGPSVVTDTACSSSMLALDEAYKAIRLGLCDSAIVGGTQLVLHPFATLQFARLGVLNFDGGCKTFDANANGYVRSEAIAAIFLQKAKDAKRIYAKIVHAKTNCDGFKEQGITYPNGEIQQRLFRELYYECEVDPQSIKFIEAHGTSTRVGDPEEVINIDKMFHKNRKTPLLIGSVKSNMGHSEPSSGLCSISKVIITMETGFIPPNLHYKSPRKGVEALEQGRVKVVTEKTPLPGNECEKIGLNNFGFGGANVHALLQQNAKKKINGGQPKDDLPRLVCLSGRVPETVVGIINDLTSRPLDSEYVSLLHNIYRKHIPGNLYRGYVIMSKYSEIERSTHFYNDEPREVCIGFSTFENSWEMIGRDLVTLPLFKATLKNIQNILSSKKVNIFDIVMNTAQDDRINNYVLANVIIQLCIFDILKTLGVRPVKVFGDGLGALICAYADDDMSMDETVQIAYEMARILKNVPTPKSIHASQMNGQKNGIEIPYENTYKNGPTKASVVTKVTEATNKFTKNINGKHIEDYKTSGTEQILKIEDIKQHKAEMVQIFKTLLRKPRTKSEKWVNSLSSRAVDAEYLADAITTPIDYKLLKDKIPHRAIVLEIGSRQMCIILEALLKHKEIETVYFDHINNVDNVITFLSALGSLYKYGCDLKLDEMYPKVEFPVSRGTPMIAPHIKWDHSAEWFVCLQRNLQMKKEKKTTCRSYDVDIKDGRFSYVRGHVIDGLTLFPATGYLYLVLETVCFMTETLLSDIRVVFHNCKFNRATTIPKDGSVRLDVMIHLGSGDFEVSENQTSIVTGNVKVLPYDDFVILPELEGLRGDEVLPMKAKDVYKELKLRGYSYRELFRSVVECDSSAQRGLIHWSDNIVAFMDNMLQVKILQIDSRALFVPTFIEKLTYDARQHQEYVKQYQETGNIPVFAYPDCDIIRSGAIEIRGLKASSITRRKPLGEPVLEKYVFIANEADIPLEHAIRVNMQLILENDYNVKIKVVEVIDEATDQNSRPLGPIIAAVFGDQPLIAATVSLFSEKPVEDVDNITVENKKLSSESECMLVVGSNLLSREEVTKEAFAALKENGFILSREPLETDPYKTAIKNISILTVYSTDKEKVVMFKKNTHFTPLAIIQVSNDNFKWLEQIKEPISDNKNFIIYAQDEPLSGIIGLLNCIRKEPVGNRARCFFISDKDAPKFNLDHEFYKSQFSKNLAINVYKDGKWGTFRHLLLEDLKEIECEHCFASTTVRGDLSSFRWIEGPIDLKEPVEHPEKAPVHVYYSGVNFKDVMLGSGRLNIDDTNLDRTYREGYLGIEFSGRAANGRRVMGMVEGGGIGTMLMAYKDFLFPVPEEWSLEEAVTVPCVYITVLYGIYRAGGLKRGESILIHSGAGGIGQAAINVALHIGCEIFTTVGTAEKRDFIKKMFPKIDDAHIGNSRDMSFEQMIMQQTNGKGVDVVLNSLAEEKLITSVRCLGRGGRFIEIGKFDMANNNKLQTMLLEKEASYHGVMVDQFFKSSPSDKVILKELLFSGIKSGCVKPLKTHLFERDQVEEAFRFMSSGKHIGKVVIKILEEEAEKVVSPKARKWKALPRYYAKDDKSYIICGGLGGFGLELADWLVLRGARKLVLTSRTGVKNGYQASRIRIWKSYGTQVIISTSDITTKQGCLELIKQANSLGPVDGIFNLAVILKDALTENQTEENFITSFAPKAYATMHLDEITREHCPQLRSFVVFSSVSCGRGNAGQTNYGMANSIMERICENRRRDGYPAVAVEWGAVGDVGLVADMQEEDKELEIGGTLQQKISSCLEVMDIFLKQENPVVASMVVAEKQIGASADNCVDAVANILGIKNLKTISPQVTLAELGMDSMRAVEVKQTLERDFDIILTAKEIRNLTFNKLQEFSTTSDDQEASKTKVLNEGIDFFIGLIDEDLSNSKVDLDMPTKIPNESPAPKVLMFPGVEGVANLLRPLTDNLECHAIAMQFAYHSGNDIMETAQKLIPYVESNSANEEHIKLIGYSYGCILALEIAAILEAKGKSVKIILIDGFPEVVKVFLRGINNDEDFDTQLIQRIILMFATEAIATETMDKISKCVGIENKISMALNLTVKDKSSEESKKNLQKLMTTMHKLLKTGSKYQPSYNKLKSPVLLLKPEEQLIPDLPDDYGLSNYCEQEVKSYTFKGNHSSMLEDPLLSDMINKWARE